MSLTRYKSKAQAKKLHILMSQGKISKEAIAKLDKASEGLNLPKHVKNVGKPPNVRTIRK